MQISLKTQHVKAAALCAATQDIRYYLNGLFVESRRTETRIVGSTGSCLALLRDTSVEGQEPVPDVIIPIATVRLAVQTKSPLIALSCDAGAGWSLGGIAFEPVDGRYPDYRRMFTSAHSGEAAQFGPGLIAIFAKLAKTLGVKRSPVIRHNGNAGAQVQVPGMDAEFVGVIMPLRPYSNEHPDPGVVHWWRERN